MKHLTIVRHAKSSWKDPGLADFDRPLNERGTRDAPRMAERIAARQPAPDRILSSPAVRAHSTATIVARALDYDPAQVDRLDALYLASRESLLHTVRALDDAWQRVLVIGHNPGLTELVNLLTASALDDIPTCGVVELELASDSWRAIGPGTAELVEFDYPKKDSSQDGAASQD